jgi:hypothetical protein
VEVSAWHREVGWHNCEQAEEELPPWVRREQEQKLREKEGGGDLPFGVYLIASSLVAIAAVTSTPLSVFSRPVSCPCTWGDPCDSSLSLTNRRLSFLPLDLEVFWTNNACLHVFA